MAHDAGDEAHASVEQGERGDLAARQDVVADRDLLEPTRGDDPLVDALEAPANERDARARLRARAPGPASADARAARGEGAGAGSSAARPASRLAASTSARSTMPAPPPAGVSSTARWRPTPWSRMSCAASAHSPRARPSPASERPSGPGNIAGNRVKTSARHIVELSGWMIPRLMSGRSPLRKRGGTDGDRHRRAPQPTRRENAHDCTKGGGRARLSSYKHSVIYMEYIALGAV